MAVIAILVRRVEVATMPTVGTMGQANVQKRNRNRSGRI